MALKTRDCANLLIWAVWSNLRLSLILEPAPSLGISVPRDPSGPHPVEVSKDFFVFRFTLGY